VVTALAAPQLGRSSLKKNQTRGLALPVRAKRAREDARQWARLVARTLHPRDRRVRRKGGRANAALVRATDELGESKGKKAKQLTLMRGA
jgi:hypothetical protein